MFFKLPNKSITKYILLALLIVFVVLVPLAVIQSKGFVPCGGEGENECNLCYLFLMLSNVMNYMVNMVGIIAVVFLVIGGGVKVISGGSEELNKKGNGIITNTIIGTVIVLVAWLLINTIFTIAGFTRENIGLTGNWFEFTCTVGGDAIEESKTITVTPTSHNFGIVDVGSSSEQDFTVSIPPESGELKIEYALKSNNLDNFSLEPPSDTEIPNSQAITENKSKVTFAPTDADVKHATLSIIVEGKTDGQTKFSANVNITGGKSEGDLIFNGETPDTCSPCDRTSKDWTPELCEASVEAATNKYTDVEKEFLKAIMWRENKGFGYVKLTAKNNNENDGTRSCGPMQVNTKFYPHCEEMFDRNGAGVMKGAEFISQEIIKKGEIDFYEKEYGIDRIILMGAAYNGGNGANVESNDCGKGKNCANQTNPTGYPDRNKVPKWLCEWDYENKQCELNYKGPGDKKNFHITRSYAPDVKSAYDKYKSPECQK